MKNLDDEQINAIVQWLNSWDQLKGTAIPLRFKEDFSRMRESKIKKLAEEFVAKFFLEGNGLVKCDLCGADNCMDNETCINCNNKMVYNQ